MVTPAARATSCRVTLCGDGGRIGIRSSPENVISELLTFFPLCRNKESFSLINEKFAFPLRSVPEMKRKIKRI